MSADRSGASHDGSRDQKVTPDGTPEVPASDAEADEWGEESFPASDPPENWAGQDRDLRSPSDRPG